MNTTTEVKPQANRIFISYKRTDKEVVFKIKDKVENATREKCWIDLDGIESDAMFKSVIIRAINECEVFLFMYSQKHSEITDFENDWTIKELNFASKKKKRVVFVNIDGSELSDLFLFDYDIKQQIDGRSSESVERLCSDLKKWLNITNTISSRGQQAHQPSPSYRESIPEEKDLTFSIKGVSFKMIKVEGGTFTMGATKEQGDGCELPAHQVTLSDYYIGQTEVTQALWTAVMGNNPSEFKGDKLPVEQVSWDDCQSFIEELNSMLSKELGGMRFALPTEAQWEFAARGGNKSQGYRYAGSNDINDVAWYEDNSGGMTHPVAQKQPNELGLYDMSGNVFEWCQDLSGRYSSDAQTNPQGPAFGSDREIRGGGWYDSYDFCRVYDRSCSEPCDRFSSYGLRLCLLPVSVNQKQTKTVKLSPLKETSGALLGDIYGVTFKMVKVEGGTFTMGATAEQGKDFLGFLRPAHQVTLTDDYYIGQTEVTQALWKAVMGSNPSKFKGDNLPVEEVSWDDCQAFIEKLNSMLSNELGGKRFALPTEAQWEFAARGGNKSQGYKYAGSNEIDDVAWYRNNSGYKTHSVAQKQPNELGLYDMSGNVREWCQDWYGSYSSDAQTNPQGPASGEWRVIRSGHWIRNAKDCRVSIRGNEKPGYRDYDLGFRLCLRP